MKNRKQLIAYLELMLAKSIDNNQLESEDMLSKLIKSLKNDTF